jgi:glycine/D-amino acid oxidase-like deaminating enzyme/nitrite reductase/ring-hydroxylating ferredoxin subunit
MDTVSLWQKLTSPSQAFPSLNNDIECDVVIIGGGITGITTAFELINSGKKVVVLEKDLVGGGTTGYSTGNLYVAVQPYYQKLISSFDKDTVGKIAQSRNSAIDYIEEKVNAHNIDCEFERRPWFLYSATEDDTEKVEKEVEAIKECGLEINFIDDLPIPIKIIKAAKMERQGRFNPWKYTLALAKEASKNGIEIYEKANVVNFEENDNGVIVETDSHKIKAKYLIHATHTPKGINLIQALAAPYRSYVVSARINGEVPNGNFWDVHTPHHVTSSHKSGFSDKHDLLMIAGSHHKTGQPKDENNSGHYEELEEYLTRHYDVKEISHRWSAQHYQAADGIPYIGKSPGSERMFIAGGFFADGLVYGTVAGKLIADILLERKNDLEEIYNPSRFTPVASAKSFMKENLNDLIQYLKDYPGASDADSFMEIGKCEGKLIEIDGEKFGAYKDEKGEEYIVSAVCPHLDCIVQFNNVEKTWDCPCHGSRFKINGDLIEGPALVGLKRIESFETLKEK